MKVSVYCLAYNHAEYIRSALDGFVSQKTDFPYEVFVHDDASTDNTQDIIREYAEKYPDIIKPVFQQENQKSKGALIMHQFLLPHMTGEYIAVCEGDDYWTDPLKLQKQVDFLDAHPEYSACVHNTMRLDMTSGAMVPMFECSQDHDIVTEDVISRGSAAYHTSALMYRLKYANNLPGFYFKSKGFKDYPQSIYLSLCGKIRFISQVMSTYRMGTAGSWTVRTMSDNRKRMRVLRSNIEVLEAVDEHTDGKYHQVIEDSIRRYEYQYLFIDGQYAQMRKEPYTKLYREEPFGERVKMRIKQYSGPIYRLFSKIKQRRNGNS